MGTLGAWRRIPRPLRWALCLAGIPLLLLLAAWLVFYAVASARLSEALASARADGHRLSFAELAPPPLPPDRNAAPHFIAAFALHPDPKEADPILATAAEGFALLRPEDKEHVRAVLARCPDLFERVRAGRGIGGCRYERDYSQGILAELPEVGGALRTARLLKIRAESEAESGRPAEARETVRDLLALADSFKGEPLLISQLMRLIITTLGLEVVHRTVKAKTPEADLRAWIEIAPRPETLDGMISSAYAGELAWGAQLAGRPLSEGLVAADKSQKPGWLAQTNLLAPYWKILGSNYVKRMTRVVEASRKPYLEARPELESLVGDLREKKPAWDLLSVLLIPAIVKPLDSHAQVQAVLAVTRTGLEWELERAARGHYPEQVRTLDPLIGKTLRYEPDAGRISSAGRPEMSPHDLELALLVWKLRHAPRK